MKLARSAKTKMPLALNQLVETHINGNTKFLGVHEPSVGQWFPVG